MIAGECSICWTQVERNRRGELLHVNRMQTANDHAAQLVGTSAAEHGGE